jgi:hypothetical protein
MTEGGFLSTVSVETILVGVGALAVLSATTLASLHKHERRSVVAFFVCLVAVWAGATLVIYLMRHALCHRAADPNRVAASPLLRLPLPAP